MYIPYGMTDEHYAGAPPCVCRPLSNARAELRARNAAHRATRYAIENSGLKDAFCNVNASKGNKIEIRRSLPIAKG
jgi:hypothetical protein